jgi:hypothetical protein
MRIFSAIALFIFFPAEENGTKRKRPCHEPFGFVCASWPQPDAPKLAPLISGTQTVAASFPSATPMRDLVTKGDSQTKHEILVSSFIMMV